MTDASPRHVAPMDAARASPGTIHLVYPHGDRISCPDAIGRELGRRLARRYRVRLYDWDAATTIDPGPGDVLVGHPHPAPWTIFRRSARRAGWRRVIALSPYHHGDDVQVAFLDRIVCAADLYLAITGRYWFSSIGASTFAHWRPKMVHMDLAVDREHFPVLRREFNPPGRRRIVYVGHSGWTKNPEYLSAIAAALPAGAISWIGRGEAPIAGVTALGGHDFATPAGRAAVAAHDFLITVGRADANPTTVLEAMAWGLVPICTPQSGYVGYAGVANVPLDDAPGAAAVIEDLQRAPAERLQAMQAANWELLDTHFHWDRFARQVIEAIESDASPSCLPVTRERRRAIRRAALLSPYAPWRPAAWRAAVSAALRARRPMRQAPR
jgi:glycosyltransferase involved in cell wall biosynthesis